ncbi:MAG TPA: MgtC/SapB family protein [Thiobacillaceae bacterium]|nr:MgtC/SapB family protein [Thiobacillaceae bacterium]
MQSDQLSALFPFLTSLALGLLIGLERERSPAAKAGLRTFSLVALAGTVGALLSEKTGAPWVLGGGLLIMGGMMVASYFKDDEAEDPGTTTIAAVVVCYGLGAMVWYGMEQLAVTLAILATALLYFKPELRGVSRSLTRLDLVSILQFAVLSFVILPILPDKDYGPYHALNPYQIWWMVVLISGLSLAGYAALRIAGQRHGTLLTGLFGGIASSTATTLAFSRHGRDNPHLVGMAALIILLANWVVLIRLSLVVAVLQPGLLRPMLTLLGGGATAGLIVLYLYLRRLSEKADAPALEIKNPTEIRAALSFGLLYAGVLFAAAWLSDWVGSQGVYAVALVSGLTDVDAITLSSLRLFGLGNLVPDQVATTVLLALLANIAFKSGLATVIGGASLARQVLPGMGAVAAGLLAGWLFV